jgi:hypothetical protein
MTAALILPISGPYTGVYNALPLGTQQDDGYTLSATWPMQAIEATDAFGQTLVESIYRGVNWRIAFRGLEWSKTGILATLQTFGGDATGASFAPTLSNVGDRASKFYKTMLLTAILGNPPTTPQTLTALLAGLAPGSQTSMNLTSKMREVPTEFCLLPYSSTSGSVTSVIPFSTT